MVLVTENMPIKHVAPNDIIVYVPIEKYIDGGFRERFKDYNKFFYSKFIPNCNTCAQYATMHSGPDGERVTVKRN